jgi:hypothetical protein
MADPVIVTNPTIPQDNIPPGTENVNTSNKSIFDSQKYASQKYNENYYNVDLYLDNSGNFENPKRYFINPSAVLGLFISDTVNDWVVDGSLTFMYLPGGLEDLDKATTGSASPTPVSGKTQAAADVGESLKDYLFRGDGFDLLRIMISPISREADGAEARPGDGLNITMNDTNWTLSYLFSIYEIEDVRDVPELQGAMGSYLKCLKLKFHDVRYQLLQTSNVEYSSAEPKDNAYESNFQSEMAPGQGVMYTGDMLRDIMNHTLADDAIGGCKEFEIELTEDRTLWDKGKAELFYTSPAGWSVSDDVDYIFSHHVSEKELNGGVNNSIGSVSNDMALLHTERSKKPGFLEDIRLTALSVFFEKAGSAFDQPGELQKEHFFVTAFTEETSLTNLHLAPIGGDGTNTDLKTSKYGQIMSFSFVDMSPSVNSNMFCSTPVYSVDIRDRIFNVEFEGNDIMSARRLIANSYISKLFKQGEDNESLFLPTIHKNKKDINVFPTFSLNGNNPAVRQRNGLHNLLYTGVFQNACICFKVLGLTFRESGTFIGIDKSDGCPENDYNNKLFGQWFVVKVDHVFEAGAYVNFIYAVKIHRHRTLQTKFEGTLTN